MTDLEEEMEQTAERARALGVGGNTPDDGGAAVESGPESSSETSETSETSPPSETDEADETPRREPGGLDDHVYPNPDKELGSLVDTYENFNVYVPPAVKEEVNAFYKELDYEFSRDHGTELDKHWDFYTALFRAVLDNRDVVREELERDD